MSTNAFSLQSIQIVPSLCGYTSQWLHKVSSGTLLYLEITVAEVHLQVQCTHLKIISLLNLLLNFVYIYCESTLFPG